MRKINYKILIIIGILLLGLTSCDKNEHFHEEVIDEALAATCTKEGLTTGMHCATCKEIIVAQEKVPMLEHTYTAATCEKPATCTVCGKTNGNPLEHNFGEWIKVSEGLEKRECQNCSHFETKEIYPVHTHKEEVLASKDATCTEAGLTEGKKCSECGEILVAQTTIEATGHSFGDWYKESETMEKRDCKNCSHFETKEIKVEHTHNFGNWFTVINAGCVTEGEEQRFCDSCSEYESRKTKATGHELGDWYIDVPATLTKEGVEKRDCKNCSYFETKSIPTSEAPDAKETVALLQADLDAISLPMTLSSNYQYTNTGKNGTKFTYLSSNAGVLDDEGNVTRMLYDVDVTVRVIGTLNGVEKEKQVTIKVLKYELPDKTHQIILNAADFPVPDNSSTFKKGNGYIELNTNKVNNYFYCGEGEEYIAPKPFTGVVVSWGAIDTSSTAKVTVEIKLRVNGTWSDYVSYGAWGFEGSNGNASKTDSTGLIKISTDEVMVLNGKTADAIRYKVNLSRSSASAVSPKIKYLSFAFDYSSYSYSVNRNHLPESVFYNVPKRYQLDVTSTTNGSSGNVMCSATSTTMMLEYYGIDLSAKTKAYGYTYPQEYIARKVVRDVNMSGGGFGNWVYNTVSMSHYGFKSYVAKYYSIEELMYDLTKGPVALSIKKCTMTQYENYKTYTHSGHIIVAVGYKYINGQLYITCNDPYVKEVTCNYSANLITNYWKYIGYVIE